MIKPRPAPEPAAQGLIQQPAVRHHIHGGIGRFHGHRAEGSIPIGPDAFEGNAAGVRPPKTLDQMLHLPGVPTEPEAKARLPFLPVGQIERDLDRAARIQPRADVAGKAGALQRRRLRQASIPAKKLLPVPGEGAHSIADIDERNAIGKLGVVIVARQQRTGPEIHFRLHVQQALLPQIAQYPFEIAGGRQAPRTPRDIAQFQDHELDRRVHRHVDPQLGGDAMLGVFKYGVAEAMADDIGHRAARGQRRGRPELSALLIADVKGLARGVPDGIVAPGRQAKLMRVVRPSVGAAAL